MVEPSRRTVLVVDDRVDALTAVRKLLEHEGHRVLTAESSAAAVAVLAAEPVHLVLVDHMPVDLIRRVRERDALVQIVLQTRSGEQPPREVLRDLAIQSCHDERDGPERLLLSVDLALRASEQLGQLRVAERLKTELLANVSHEFRTPLAVIMGYVDLLRDGSFGTCPGEALPVLDKLRGNAAYLLDLVEEFLDLSKLEAGAMVMRREAIALTPFLRELGDWFALLARGRPIAFVTEVPDALPVVAADTAKLRVVVQNLLNNAEKFTQAGEVRLSASPIDSGRVAIRVSDTGPGIAPEHHEAVFGMFHQLGPCDKQAKGVGLGLALARRFARMMGGDVTLESTVGRGTIFTIVLPVAARSLPAASDDAA